MKKSAYARAGVDLKKVKDIQSSVAKTLETTFATRASKVGRPIGAIGHYAGLVDIGHNKALAMHTDGVGTKVLVAMAMGKFDTVGIDCVAMTVNDLICVGSEPIALVDYIALDRPNDALVSELMKGLVAGAKEAATPVVGGETAIMGDTVRGFDLVSMGVGLVDRDKVVDGSAMVAGDRVIGLSSSGLHSNGYTLARRILLKRRSLRDYVPELERTVGEEMLKPTRIYVRPVLEALRKLEVHGIGHITGGSFSKLNRLVGGRKLGFELELPAPPPVFSLLKKEGRLSEADMLGTFNMGIGLCVCVPASDAEAAVKLFRRAGFPASDIGAVNDMPGVRLGSVFFPA